MVKEVLTKLQRSIDLKSLNSGCMVTLEHNLWVSGDAEQKALGSNWIVFTDRSYRDCIYPSSGGAPDKTRWYVSIKASGPSDSMIVTQSSTTLRKPFQAVVDSD